MLKPWLIGNVLAALICSFFFGRHVATAEYEAALLEQERKAAEQFRAYTKAQEEQSQRISKELSDERRKREGEANAFRDALRRARTAAVPLAVCPPPAALKPDGRPAEPLFSTQFVWLWNIATDPGAAAGADPAGVDGAAATAGAVGAEDVLEVHHANAVIARECRAKLNQWQALARANGWAK